MASTPCLGHQSLWALEFGITVIDVMRHLLILLILSAPAFAKSAQSTKLKEKLNCSAKELRRQDCHLVSGDYDIRLLAKTVAWTDGIWHTVDPMPLGGDAVEWERAGFRMMAGHPILQVWLWEKGLGETQVQSLHWYVADAEKRKFTILSEGIVRKRRPETVVVDAKKPAPQKFIYDGWEPHYVKALASGALEWQLSGQKKNLPMTTSHGHSER